MSFAGRADASEGIAASEDRVLLRHRGGSLTFRDATGALRTVRHGEEFEADRATAQLLVDGDPYNVVAVPRDLIALRQRRRDLPRDELDRRYESAIRRLGSLGETPSLEAISVEVDRLAPPPDGIMAAPEQLGAPTRSRGGRPLGTTRTIPGDDEYRHRWGLYLRDCSEHDLTPTLSGFSTWSGTHAESGSPWPLSTLKDYRRRARERGVSLPP